MAVQTVAPEISDEELIAKFPHADIDHDNKPFFRGLLQRKLLYPRCNDCGNWMYTYRDVCNYCWSRNVVPAEIGGTGTVFFFILLHQGPQELAKDYSEPVPLVSIELDEQPVDPKKPGGKPAFRITPEVINVKAEDLKIGMRMELTWIERGGIPVPAFQPAKEGGR